MSKQLLTYIISAIALFVSSTITLANNTKCGQRNEIIQLLEAKYKEGRVAVALSQRSTEAFEIFVSDKGTWTAMLTTTDGKTCIMAAGHSWETVNETIMGQKS